MKEIRNVQLSINDLMIEARFYEDTIQCVFIPLLHHLSEIAKSKQQRVIVFLVAPPAVGKSTLAHYLAQLSREEAGICPILSVGLDGFHYHQDYIETHTVHRNHQEIPMKDVKGSPESYDLVKLKKALQALLKEDILWPIYSREKHDVVEDAILIQEQIVLIEGNWLLLKEEGWKDLKDFADFTIFIDAESSLLKNRLIKRKIMGGKTKEQAIEFVEKSDMLNIIRVCQNSQKANFTLKLKENGDFQGGTKNEI